MTTRKAKTGTFAVATCVAITLILQYETEASWLRSALWGALATPLAFWMSWVRTRMNEHARGGAAATHADARPGRRTIPGIPTRLLLSEIRAFPGRITPTR
ncbi:hypothetical protein [Streptomyces sp. Ac-502]|uniref:hypothetical protein n=1 Tax=Streptomyces sp. Ac-502 TaxID=3342801 RepID=UPI0038628B2D